MLTILYAKLDDDSELQLSLERLDSLRKKFVILQVIKLHV